MRRFVRLRAAIACLLAAGTPAAATVPHGSAYCAQNSGVAAADTSARTTQGFLDAMRQVGVQTIIRYYDHADETLPGKTLRRNERNLIIQNGFRIGVVFQHFNNKFSSFTPERGWQDADRSLALAVENLQPTGSAIYFGVDGPWGRAPSELDRIMAYFWAANDRLKTSGYRVGVYGSGLVCSALLQQGLARLCWLANARSWPGYEAYIGTRRWSLVQSLPTNCAGRQVDFNFGNETQPDHGQFGQ